jgi:hypothetical protein
MSRRRAAPELTQPPRGAWREATGLGRSQPGILCSTVFAGGLGLIEDKATRAIDPARAIAPRDDPIPVALLRLNPAAACYRDMHHAGQLRSHEHMRTGFDRELGEHPVWPEGDPD